MNKPILALNGGGMRGIYTAYILSKIEKELNKPIFELFDLISGNSTGGILAVALGKGIPANIIVDLYLKRGKDIFAKKKGLGRITNFWGALDERYEIDNLTTVLKEYFGNTLISKSLTNTMVVTYDLARGEPLFINSWKEEHTNIPMWVAASGTADAPTYFERLVWGGYAFVDGGTCAVTHPTISAIAEAKKLGRDLEKIKVLNIGTGVYKEIFDIEKAKSWGILKGIQPIVNILLSGSSQATVYQAKQLLEDNYLYIDSLISKELSPMDKWQNCPDLVKMAEKEWEKRGKEI